MWGTVSAEPFPPTLVCSFHRFLLTSVGKKISPNLESRQKDDYVPLQSGMRALFRYPAGHGLGDRDSCAGGCSRELHWSGSEKKGKIGPRRSWPASGGGSTHPMESSGAGETLHWGPKLRQEDQALSHLFKPPPPQGDGEGGVTLGRQLPPSKVQSCKRSAADIRRW